MNIYDYGKGLHLLQLFKGYMITSKTNNDYYGSSAVEGRANTSFAETRACYLLKCSL